MKVSKNRRTAGYDHNIFSMSAFNEKSSVSLSDGKVVGITLAFVLQRFHLDAAPPFPVPGMLSRPYPDVGNASQREVGLRDGLWRILDLLDELEIPASFVVEKDALELLGDSVDALGQARHTIVAGGEHATRLHTDSMNSEEEASLIDKCRQAIAEAFGRDVRGWRSPYSAQSPNTLSLLAAAGFEYCCDWCNDDRPYWLQTPSGRLVSVPLLHATSDLHNLEVAHQSTDAFLRSQRKGLDWLSNSQRKTPVLMSMVAHPWIMGTPHRFREFREHLIALKEHLASDFVTCDHIATAFLATS